MIKNFFKKITGIKAIEDAKAQAEAELVVAEKLTAQKIQEAVDAGTKAEEAKMSAKQLATRRKEPWVSVLETHVNKDNPANGFFELDWNEFFVTQLRQAGYGLEGDPDELVVDLWFKTLARNMLSDEGLEMNRSQGFINVQKLDATRSEIG